MPLCKGGRQAFVWRSERGIESRIAPLRESHTFLSWKIGRGGVGIGKSASAPFTDHNGTESKGRQDLGVGVGEGRCDDDDDDAQSPSTDGSGGGP